MLKTYTRDWARAYRAEEEKIKAVSDDGFEGVHHVGSTSVPGLSAEPTIDVLIVLNRPMTEDEIAKMIALGYDARGEDGMPGRQFFVKRGEPSFDVYAFHYEHPASHAMVNFRNYLLGTPEAKTEFEEAKRKLESEHGADPAAYAREKDRLLLSFDQRGARWAAEREAKRHREKSTEDLPPLPGGGGGGISTG